MTPVLSDILVGSLSPSVPVSVFTRGPGGTTGRKDPRPESGGGSQSQRSDVQRFYTFT